ncbi:NADPH dehydrogenase NamA [Anoxybacterium hadale]|uniref:NADPH dehydrogenase NamA n=1 Tax=Anoxybacterium hadale TaxID=3408580 RepID=A0ACD1AA97_9FIRM|nr:NADPH dehydrogenase NamA [Clostridiales bacterium]
MKKLFTEYQIKNLTFKNRIVMPPMCMYCAPETGLVTDWHVVHYGSRAVGGSGLITVEATGIAPEGRLTSNDLGIWDDSHIEGLSRIVSAIHDGGAMAAIQINHGGRKCEAKGMQIEAPSPIPYEEGGTVPREMTKQDIANTVMEFKNAAIRADKAGFDLIQIHAAHGYLLSEFLSPLTNKRTDEYGGSYENRVRFLGEVLDAVREVWSAEKPIEVRISAEDYQEGGNKAEDLAAMLNLVKHKGIDAVNVSTGGVVAVVPKTYPGYQTSHAEKIKRLTSLPTSCGGLITKAEEAESILQEGKGELVYLGRELLRNPYWPFYAAHELNCDVSWPKQYERAKPRK